MFRSLLALSALASAEGDAIGFIISSVAVAVSMTYIALTRAR